VKAGARFVSRKKPLRVNGLLSFWKLLTLKLLRDSLSVAVRFVFYFFAVVAD
jgi:hypothetical protein